MSSGKGHISAEILEDVLLCCRYGELDELKEHVENFGPQALETARDENGNTVLHMAAGNGHDGALPDTLNFRVLGRHRRFEYS